MNNLLIQQFGVYKREWLNEQPYECLLNSKIDINPHQIDAFCSAITAIKTGGIILADEVGLGKTIEAGLVLRYLIKNGITKILLVLPASLRKQWEIELFDKFGFTYEDVKIVDRTYFNYGQVRVLERWLLNNKGIKLAITSYDFSSKLIQEYSQIKWDLVIVDEAHNLRNVFHGTKRAKKLYELTQGIPKILLTATPLQNSLEDLHGLVSFIDNRIFGSEAEFKNKYMTADDYSELKEKISPVIYRTLRKDVSKYMHFASRECRTFDFELSIEEKELYSSVNEFLKKEDLYCVPTRNRNLILLVIRKLLASSSFALIETFEVMKDRLEKIWQGSENAKAIEGFELFLQYLDDEIDEDDFEDEDEDLIIKRQVIEKEIVDIEKIISLAKQIKVNAKIKALLQAIQVALKMQLDRGISQKIVIFTESKRTQKYICDELVNAGYSDDDIVMFNGDNTDLKARQIYEQYIAKHFGEINYGPAVEKKHAIVEYFESNAKILILTDAGSEGLNLQFCNTIINYDLPWNPMKIEQRIGRCHRYGQKNNVVAINLLNTGNVADKRVYDILSKKFELFNGVFGASNIALGILESGVNFEKEVLSIYQNCDTQAEFNREFDKLDRVLNAKKNERARQLRDILLSKTEKEKINDLDSTKNTIERYLKDYDYWQNVEDDELVDWNSFWIAKQWGEKVFGCHGFLFVGGFYCNKRIVYPVLLITDEKGNYVDFAEEEILKELTKLDDQDIFYYNYTDEENDFVLHIYDNLQSEMLKKYDKELNEIKAYNKRKVDNWVAIQIDQYNLDIQKLINDANELTLEAQCSDFPLEKRDLEKKAKEKIEKAEFMRLKFEEKAKSFRDDGEKEINNFNDSLIVNPTLLIKIIMKF